MALHGGLLAIDIDEVGDRLECVEADADGQCNLGVGYRDAESRQLLGKETQILEGAKDQDIACQSTCESPLAGSTLCMADAQTSQIVE